MMKIIHQAHGAKMNKLGLSLEDDDKLILDLDYELLLKSTPNPPGGEGCLLAFIHHGRGDSDLTWRIHMDGRWKGDPFDSDLPVKRPCNICISTI
uniref:Uncharacterized protein n=1 Tax=Oncorhynchus kisutch TaxID=8019 RepID=A0A8C7GNU0_ONCKI